MREDKGGALEQARRQSYAPAAHDAGMAETEAERCI